MEQVKKEVLKARLKMAVVVILSITIGVSFMYAYQVYQSLLGDFNRTSGAVVGKCLTVAADVQGEEEGDKGSLKTTLPSISDIDEVIDKIAILESSNGKNQPAYCTDRGLINKWGYGVYGDNITCFKNDYEAKQTIAQWFKKHTDSGFSLEEVLCLYNTGTASLSCPYLEKYQSLT